MRRFIGYRVEPFGNGHPASAKDLSALHNALLPRSPIVKLGAGFLRDYYYRVLPDGDFIFGFVAYVDNDPVGFICVTDDSDGFMRKAFLRRPARLLWSLLAAVARSPMRFGPLWEVFLIMILRSGKRSKRQDAEVLSFGVLPQFRAREFVRASAIRISEDLMDRSREALLQRGVSSIRIVVDADNTTAISFYSKHGWTLDRDHVLGWKTPSQEMIWIPSPRRAGAIPPKNAFYEAETSNE